jgi:hypothetical protein
MAPTIPDRGPERIPAELRDLPQWVLWRSERRDGKATKVPYQAKYPTRRASSTDPTTWASYEEVLRSAAEVDGVGFVFSDSDPFAGVDFDHCVDAEGIDPHVENHIRQLDSYAETSVSGNGIHVIMKASVNGDRCRTGKTAWNGDFETYDRARFFTITGDHVPGTPATINERQAALNTVREHIFAPPKEKPRAEPHGDDHDLLERARKARNGTKFSRLYDSAGHEGYASDSEADLALCDLLAFWTGPDHARIDGLFRFSARMREKWDSRRGESTYGEQTIARALGGRTEFYKEAAPESETPEDEPESATDEEPAPKKAAKTAGSQADVIVALAHGSDIELWGSTSDEPYITIPTGGHCEHHKLSTRGARDWLAHLHYQVRRKLPSAQAVQDALAVLRAEALWEGDRHEVHVRHAGVGDDAVYLDLGDRDWRVVEITAGGWRIIADPPVRFRRPRGMLPLIEPVRGGSLQGLKDLLNVEDDTWTLVMGFLVGAMAPRGPYPVLGLHGEEGTAKSSAAALLRSVTDPNVAPLRSEPRDVRDLMVAASNGRVIAFDNVSHLPTWLSDALCRLATGGGFSTRELYSDGDEVIFNAKRPVILTAVTEVATRGDLVSRSLLANLRPIDAEKVMLEEEVDASWQKAQPAVLGALLDATVCALRRKHEVRPKRLPRLADHARWVTAAEPALGWKDDHYLSVFDRARIEGVETVLESSQIFDPVKKVAASGFEGSATDLLAQLSGHVDEKVTRRKDWPTSPRALSGELRRLAPSLRRIGISIDRERTNDRRVIKIWKEDAQKGDAKDRHDRHDRHAEGEKPGPARENAAKQRDANDAGVTQGDASVTQGAPPKPPENGAYDGRDANDAGMHPLSNESPEGEGEGGAQPPDPARTRAHSQAEGVVDPAEPLAGEYIADQRRAERLAARSGVAA